MKFIKTNSGEEGHEFLVIHGPKGSGHRLPITVIFQIR